jgi:hypothetical protein
MMRPNYGLMRNDLSGVGSRLWRAQKKTPQAFLNAPQGAIYAGSCWLMQ